jgi:Transmembrane secretion effector
MRFFGLWNNVFFMRLWVGQTISVFGSMVGGLALPWVALISLNATPFQVALLGMMALIPGFLVGLFAGVLVDRFPRKPVLIWSDIGRFLVLSSIPIAALLGSLSMLQLYVVAFFNGALGTFFDVAYHAYLPSLIRKDELIEGNTKLTASASVAETSGFGLAGWLVQAFTAPIAILIDAVSFLVSAISIASIRHIEPTLEKPELEDNIWLEARTGFVTIWQQPTVRTLIGSSVVLALFSRIFGSMIIVFTTRELGLLPGVQGVIFAVGGVTSLLGALAAAPLTRRFGLGATLVFSMVLLGLGMVAPTFAVGTGVLSIVLLVLNQCLTDPAWTLHNINEVTLRQSLIPNEVLGRVNGSLRFLEFGASLLGVFLGGVLGEVFGARVTLIIGSMGGFVAAIWLLFSPIWRIRDLEAV